MIKKDDYYISEISDISIKDARFNGKTIAFEKHENEDGSFSILRLKEVKTYVGFEITPWEDENWGVGSKFVAKKLTKKYNTAFEAIVANEDLIDNLIKIKDFLTYAKKHCHDTFERDGVHYANKDLCDMLGIDEDVTWDKYFRDENE